jgi:hypothetical protein
MKTVVIAAIGAAALVSGCSSSAAKTTAANNPAAAGSAAVTPTPTSAAGAADSCAGGLSGSEPGVVRITCGGTADIKISVNGVEKDMHRGQCQSAAGVWSAAVGVIIDRTGTNGKYTGPPVDSIVVNNTSDGKATVQASVNGKLYYDLGEAKLTLSADQKSAHIVGKCDRSSDAPNAAITVDVTC